MKDELSRLQEYWRDEMEAALIYERLAEAASDSRARHLLLEMRDTERRHAARWEARIRELGGVAPISLGLASSLAGPRRPREHHGQGKGDDRPG